MVFFHKAISNGGIIVWKLNLLGIGLLSFSVTLLLTMKQQINPINEPGKVLGSKVNNIPSLQQILAQDALIVKAIENNSQAVFLELQFRNHWSPEQHDNELISKYIDSSNVSAFDGNSNTVIEEGGFHTADFEIKYETIESLAIGRELILEVLYISTTEQDRRDSTDSNLNNAEVWKSKIEDSQSFENNSAILSYAIQEEKK